MVEAEPVPQWSHRTPPGGGLPLGLYLGHLEALTPAIRGSLYKSPHLQTHFAQHPMRVLVLSDQQWMGRAQPTEAATATLSTPSFIND